MESDWVYMNVPFLHDLPPSASALSGSDNKRVSGTLRCTRSLKFSPAAKTSDTRKLSKIAATG